MGKQTSIITCTCGAEIKEFAHRNGCNDEGEEYGEVNAECKNCGKDWEAWGWGEWENETQARNFLIEHICDKKENGRCCHNTNY